MSGAPVILTEVICEHPERGAAAFGVTFADASAACRYARAMRRAGYVADVSPDFETEASVASALASAARYFEHPELTEVKP